MNKEQTSALKRVKARFNADKASTGGGFGLPTGWVAFTLSRAGQALLSGGICPQGSIHT